MDLLPPEDLCRLRLASQDMYGFVEGSNRWQWEAAQSQFVRDSPDDKVRRTFLLKRPSPPP